SLGVHLNEKWNSWIEINPETAKSLGISNGDEVWVESLIGRIRTRARLFEGTMLNVVNIPFEHGHTTGGRWAKDKGANPNWIIVNEYDYLGGTTAWFSTRVKIYKVV
ncbi:MAG: molybdopterin dinucleotide binding domain-containing protein, partial [Candidatus Methanofastidiosia archaeon]